MITAVPDEIPVTSPAAFTVAIKTFEETHGLEIAGAVELESVVVLP